MTAPQLTWQRVLGALALALPLALPVAAEPVRGTANSGVAFVSGGASDEELASLRTERGQYSFWLTTAARGSGAYLADVVVRITNASGKAVLEHTMAGPWLYAALPAGRYTVAATVAQGRGGVPETQRMTAQIGSRGGLQQATLYFDTGDQTEADRTANPQAPVKR